MQVFDAHFENSSGAWVMCESAAHVCECVSHVCECAARCASRLCALDTISVCVRMCVQT